ncbi:MAG TPA: ABC transporter ATP-binding protein [Pseudomonas sp.]|nr:ABC transporter ATP-binding protein [Pseudomonas sp.]
MELIDAKQLAVPGRLHGIDLTLTPGQMLGLIGPNGSGKSTVLQCLAGIQTHAGQVALEGRDARQLPASIRARRIGLLPQACQSAWALSVSDVVALGRLPWHDRDAAAIGRAIEQTGISAWLGERVDHLSGGEQARVWLARVLAGEPQLLLADEPIASLDLLHQRNVMQLLREYAAGERGVIVALHDLALAARYCDRLCLLHGGRVQAAGTPAEVLTEANLQAVFGVEVKVDLDVHPPIVSLR